jgi:outer membrane protein insertion porin family
LEKQANKLNNFLVLQKTFKLVAALLIFGSIPQIKAQDRIPFDQGTKYILADVDVTGKISYNEQTVITFAGLEKGQDITIPGEEISNAIKKLGKLGLFSEIDFYVNKIAGDSIYLELNINELPKLGEVKFVGVRKGKVEGLIKDTGLTKGKIVNENLITTTRNYIENKYKKDGFYNTKATITTKLDTATVANEVKMLIVIDKGKKVKVKTIDINGNQMFTDAKVRAAMKNTKQKTSCVFGKRLSSSRTNTRKTSYLLWINTRRKDTVMRVSFLILLGLTRTRKTSRLKLTSRKAASITLAISAL